MKKYRVTVNGTAYEIELEELTGAAPAPAASQSAPDAPSASMEPSQRTEGLNLVKTVPTARKVTGTSR